MNLQAEVARGELAEKDLLVEQALVNGKWLAGDKESIAVEDPFTQEPFAQVPNLGEAEAARAIEAAADAFPAWAAKPAQERGGILRRWFELLQEHREDLARLITRENGKTLREARGEVDYGAGFIEFYAEEATRALGEVIPAPLQGRRLLATREPVGVAAAITPWELPARHADAQGRAGAGGGLHDRLQTRERHAADRARLR